MVLGTTLVSFVNKIKNMTHEHSQKPPKTLSGLIIAIVINIGIVIFEIILGILSNSLALVSDAFHNLTDIFSMILGYIAEKISTIPANSDKTYGYKKAEFVTAFINSLVLLIATGYIFYEGISRLLKPTEVLSVQMFYVGIIAAIGNGFATWILLKNSTENTNMKAVWLHSLQDTLLSFSVIIGAVIIYFTNWNIVDPLISIFIAIFLIRSVYALIKETLSALLDSVPANVSYDEIKKDLLNINEIDEVKDLHIWLANSKSPILSVHIQITDEKKLKTVFIKVKKMLLDKYGIQHTTLQIMPKTIIDCIKLDCDHCN